MSDNRHLLLWIDTETTAIKPEDGQLLEIGMRITDLDGTDPTAWQGHNPYAFSTIIPHATIDYTAKTATAIRMHQDNGLINEVFAGENPRYVGRWLLDSIDRLQQNGPHVTLHPAGTNVDFDIAWLKAHQKPLFNTPLWEGNVSYRKLDLSTIRLTLNAVGVNPYKAGAKPTHRVDDCLERDIFDWMHWVEWVQEHMKADDPGADCDFGPSLHERFETEDR